MCKLVRKIGKIPQYEFCEEYKSARRKQIYALEDLETAKQKLQEADQKVAELSATHCPL